MAMLLLSIAGDKAQQKAQARAIAIALAVSLLLHAALLTMSLKKPTPDEKLLTVTLLEQPEAPPKNNSRQIVSPSRSPESETAPETNRLSEKNTAVERETLRRGLPAKAQQGKKAPPSRQPEENRAPAVSPAKPEPRKNSEAVSKEKPTLRLSDATVLSTVGTVPLPQSSNRKQTLNDRIEEVRRSQATESAKPFSKFTSSGPFTGPDGVPDHLPEIPDGDITMLNSKAFAFAVFVRRVAYKVFGEFRQRSWETLPATEIRRASGTAMVLAVLNPQGELIKAELLDSSGSKSFDQVLRGAAQAGAWDRNPPPGAAAEDGNIHFLFKARSWVRPGPDGLRQQRWILLGTGLL